MIEERSALLGKALRAFKWNAIGVAARILLQFAVMVALARMIGPEDFGLFGGSMLVFGPAALIAELGFGIALVQRKDVSDDDRRMAWFWLVVSHIAVAAAIIVTAPLLANLLGDSQLQEGIRWMALALAITAFLVLPMAELRRRLDFRTLQTAQVGGYFAGYVLVGIPLAASGHGGWSLIAALVVQQAAMVVICRRIAPQPLLPRAGRLPDGLRAFGVRVVGSNIANWITENLDNLLVSRLRGLADLGLYSVSYNLARTPTNHVVNMVQQVVFAASSRAQDDEASLRRGYLALLKAIGLVTFPVFFGAAIVANSVIAGLYGTRWAEAAPVFAALCVAMPFHALMAVAGPILWGRGRTNVELRVQTGVALALVAVLFFLKDRSLAVLAWGVCVVYIGRAAFMTAALACDLRMRWREVTAALSSPLALAVVSVVVLRLVDGHFENFELSAVMRLACLIGTAGSALAVVALAFLPHVLGHELAFVLNRFPLLRRCCALRNPG